MGPQRTSLTFRLDRKFTGHRPVSRELNPADGDPGQVVQDPCNSRNASSLQRNPLIANRLKLGLVGIGRKAISRTVSREKLVGRHLIGKRAQRCSRVLAQHDFHAIVRFGPQHQCL